MPTTDDALSELLDRTRRLETRLVQLGDYVGANLRTKARIEVSVSGNGLGLHRDVPTVDIDSLDVSVSRILTELRQRNVHASAVEVFCNHQLVFTLYPNLASKA